MRNTPICGFFSAPISRPPGTLKTVQLRCGRWCFQEGCQQKHNLLRNFDTSQVPEKWQNLIQFWTKWIHNISAPNFSPGSWRTTSNLKDFAWAEFICATMVFLQSLVGWWLDGGEVNYGRKTPFLPKCPKIPLKNDCVLPSCLWSYTTWDGVSKKTHFPWAKNLPTLGLLRVLLEENLEGPLFEGSLREG